MFIRKKNNKTGSVSVQIIDKSSGSYKVYKTIGCSKDSEEIAILWQIGKKILLDISNQPTLNFLSDNDSILHDYFTNNKSLKVRVVGPELILGNIFNKIGFNKVNNDIFKHLVINRLVNPGSKLKTIDYLERFEGKYIDLSKVYRCLDNIYNKHKKQIEDITFNYTQKILGGKPGVVFYDVTTLYFESLEEDGLRKAGYSKDGKHQNPQILLGLLIGLEGLPIGYEIFEGNTYEGKTLIPVLKLFEKRFGLNKPIVVADAGLLSKENINKLKENGYKYIIGGRIKNETEDIKSKILNHTFVDKESIEIKKNDDTRLIVSFSDKRAKKDKYNRERGLKRLETRVGSGKLTKSNINNNGYNKYLELEGEIRININYEKFKQDSKWDGLKGYVTNADLTAENIIDNYKNLWQIEKAFRIKKTDLRIRPFYHRIRSRIEAHISICFVAYTVYKELERKLYLNEIPFSAKRAIELTKSMYCLDYELPETKQMKSINIGLTDEQILLKKLL